MLQSPGHLCHTHPATPVTLAWPHSLHSLNYICYKVTVRLRHCATLCEDGTCSAEVRIRIASAMTAVARLNRIWLSNTINFASKFKLYKSPVTSILVCGCETWTLLAD